jgi:pimeloyl-ACP methyl ester carboxylesterase
VTMVMADAVGIGGVRDQYLVANGARLHVVSSVGSGSPVVLLHGFPEPWLCWSRQLPAFTQAGLSVIAPDQRGYNLSDRPRAVRAYALDLLVSDVVALLDSLQLSQAAVVGHDWGAMVAWHLALARPERVSRLVTINVPHPEVFHYTLRHNPAQMLRSCYAAFFQLPWLPETLLRSSRYRLLKNALLATSRPGAFTAQDLELYTRAWSQPGALTAMLNWYRAYVRFPSRPVSGPRVRVPTLIVWGGRDIALESDMAHASLAQCDHGRLELLPEASHWVHREQPAEVNRLILDFVTQNPRS